MLDADVTLTGLDFSDSQPDKAVAEYLRRMSADVTITNNAVRIRGDRLHGAEIDMNRTPDALPPSPSPPLLPTAKPDSSTSPRPAQETDRIACMARN